MNITMVSYIQLYTLSIAVNHFVKKRNTNQSLSKVLYT